jgi:hypothetical protein
MVAPFPEIKSQLCPFFPSYLRSIPSVKFIIQPTNKKQDYPGQFYLRLSTAISPGRVCSDGLYIIQLTEKLI